MTRFHCLLTLSVALLAFLLPALPALAVHESVCQEVKPATPGLYGLCIAYCEGLDCDGAKFESAQCDVPNERLLRQYNKKKTETDPPMPCIAQGDCPCFTREDLESLEGPVSCNRGADQIRANGASCTNGDPGDFAGASSFVRGLVENTCFLSRVIQDDGLECVKEGFPAPSDITESQAQSCFQILDDFCVSLGQ